MITAEEIEKHLLNAGFVQEDDRFVDCPLDDLMPALLAIAQMGVAAQQDRTNRAYSERAATAAALARAALALGWDAGIGTDTSAESVEWSRVLYVDTPNGQVSWHIAPDDQHLVEDLPLYKGEWEGTYKSREAGSPWAKWNPETWHHMATLQHVGYLQSSSHGRYRITRPSTRPEVLMLVDGRMVGPDHFKVASVLYKFAKDFH